MIISQGYGNHLAAASDKSIVQEGDDQTLVPATMLPVVVVMSPTNDRNSTATDPANTSFCTFREVLKAASAALTNNTVAFLARGLWELNWTMASGFQANTFVASVEAHHKLMIAFTNNSQVIAAMYKGSNCQNQTGRLRLLIREPVELQLQIVATGVGDAQSCLIGLQAEKLI